MPRPRRTIYELIISQGVSCVYSQILFKKQRSTGDLPFSLIQRAPEIPPVYSFYMGGVTVNMWP